MAVQTLTQDTLNPTIQSSPIIIIDFWAPWCAPCRGFAPVFDQASEKHTDVVFAKVDTQQEQEIAAALQIRSIPTLMVFRDQVMVFREAGALPAGQLEELLQQVKSLNMDDVRKQIAEENAAT